MHGNIFTMRHSVFDLQWDMFGARRGICHEARMESELLSSESSAHTIRGTCGCMKTRGLLRPAQMQ